MDSWRSAVDNQLNRVDLGIQKLMAEGSPVKRDEALQITQALCGLLRGLKLDKSAMGKALACKSEDREIRPEDVLTRREVDLLVKAKNAEWPCPHCGQPLYGEFVYVQVTEDDYYAGVRLSCSCGFVEY